MQAHGKARQLVVDDKPFLILGGELGNSAASSVDSLNAVWPTAVGLGVNTVLMPVYWEFLEPEEGRFDFTLLTSALSGARAHGLHLVLLWFGSWKNSMSTYAPAWVKADRARFPYAERGDGRRVEILSPFSEENLRADAHAFAALLHHLAEVDARDHTVLLVQVENEVGMLEDAADRSLAARAAFASEVPAALLASGQKGGSWRDVFGVDKHADEVFMAYHLARYVDRVAAAGKAEYPLPMYVNAALNRPGRTPGDYPSGGPLPQVFDAWRAGAPSIDFLSPDIYFPNVADWCQAYARVEHPFFIPEIANNPAAAVEDFYMFGAYDAIGFSPFAIDTTSDASGAALRASYGLLRDLGPLVLESQGTGRAAGALLDGDTPKVEIPLGGAIVTIRHDYTFEWSGPAREIKPWPRAGGLVLATGPREYLVAGNGVIVTFASDSGRESLGLSRVEEGRLVAGRFVSGRRLNGDETHQGRHVRIPYGTFGLQRVTLYAY